MDFRNPLNLTPLMMAVQLGHDKLAADLVKRGANLGLTDNWGRTPLHIALRTAYGDETYARASLPSLYALLRPAATNVLAGERLVQVDCHRQAFFLFHSMLAHFETTLRVKLKDGMPGFAADDFVNVLEKLPESVIPQRFCSHKAISAALASNEVSLDAPYNRRLFLRIRRGYYVPNPALSLERDGNWVNILDVLNIPALEQERGDASLSGYIEFLRNKQQQIIAAGNVVAEPDSGGKMETAAAAISGASPAAQPDTPESLISYAVTLAPPTNVTPVVVPATSFTDTQQKRHKKVLDLLGNNVEQHIKELDWIPKNPPLAAACLLDYLGRVAKQRRISEKRVTGIIVSILLLNSWRVPDALKYTQWVLPKIKKAAFPNVYLEIMFPRLIPQVIAHNYDDDLTWLRRMILDDDGLGELPLIGLDVMACLTASRRLNPALLQRFLQYWLSADRFIDGVVQDERVWVFMKSSLEIGCSLFPVELRRELEASVRFARISRRVITLKQIKESANLPEWERTAQIKEKYILPGTNLWPQITDYLEQLDLVQRARRPSRGSSPRFYNDDDDDDYVDDYEFSWDDQQPDFQSPGEPQPTSDAVNDLSSRKISRNAPCVCGSGKKYKKCCGSKL